MKWLLSSNSSKKREFLPGPPTVVLYVSQIYCTGLGGANLLVDLYDMTVSL